MSGPVDDRRAWRFGQAVPPRRLIETRQYVLDSDWGKAQPRADAQNDYLAKHSWQEYARWHLGLTDGAMTVRVDRVGSKQAIRPPDRGLTFYWETDHLPERGRSGGPLLDGHGRVIGLCEAARGSHGYYTHLDEILAALKRGGHGWLVTPKP